MKALTITVRNPLTITGPGGSGSTAMPASEVGVPFEAEFTVAGGNETYGSWALVSTSALPRGLTLAPDGTISGTPRQAGRFPFSITISDTEAPTPRTTTFSGVINVAAKLDIVTQRVRPGKVGKLYRAKLVSSAASSRPCGRSRRGRCREASVSTASSGCSPERRARPARTASRSRSRTSSV